MVAAGTEARPTNFASFRVFHRNLDYRFRTSLKKPDHEKVAAPCGPAVKAALTCLDSARLAVILKIRCLPPM
jgi:hypothetical protein